MVWGPNKEKDTSMYTLYSLSVAENHSYFLATIKKITVTVLLLRGTPFAHTVVIGTALFGYLTKLQMKILSFTAYKPPWTASMFEQVDDDSFRDDSRIKNHD